MANPATAPVIRADATVVEIYNDGLCVYLYDEAVGPELETLISSGNFTNTARASNLYDNLQDQHFAREVARRGLAVVYELRQDDEIQIEIGVGPALTKAELKAGYWLKAQNSYLHLPSGRLRIDSPNTIPIGDEPGTDPGAVVEVPPGHYRLTLYRADWDEIERHEDFEYEGPNEFLLLTPLEGPPARAAKTPVLPYVAPIDPDGWRGAFSVDGTTFTAQVKSGYWWTPVRCNLEQAAVKQLGLEPGSLFELKVFDLTFTVLFLDRVEGIELMTAAKAVGEERLNALMERYPEFAVAVWQKWRKTLQDEGEEFLTLLRPNGQKAYPAKGHEKWVEATGRVLDERYP